MQKRTRVAPSFLASDFSVLKEEIQRLDQAGADMMHLDVMDGHFVPNISFGPAIIRAMRPHTRKTFDVHLMISPIDPFIDEFVAAGADILTVHQEAGPHLHRIIQQIKSRGIKAGIALNPATPVDAIQPVIDDVDLILIMSVNPGFGGQAFIENSLRKIGQARRMIDETGRDIDLEVDGGITPDTALRAVAAGADLLVSGTATFKGGPDAYASNINKMRY